MERRSKRVIIIPIDIYYSKLYVHFGKDINWFNRWLGRKDLPPLKAKEGDAGYTKQFKNGEIAIWIEAFPRTAVLKGYLAHEIFHATDFLLESRSFEIATGSNEAYAYLSGYITQEIYKRI